MDFVRFIRSLEEFLYEVISWLVFYPMTLWKIARRPTAMTLYTESEQADASVPQYTESLSPPLMLMLTILLTHGFEVVAGLAIPKMGPIATALYQNDKNLLIMRALLYAVFPLVVAVVGLRRTGIPLNRETLRAPFYGQCYLVVPLALAISLASAMTRISRPETTIPGLILGVAGLIWYFWAEIQWFRRQLDIGSGPAIFHAGIAVLAALLAGILATGCIALVAH